MKCLRLDTEGKPRCLIATKTVWAFTFAHLCIYPPPSITERRAEKTDFADDLSDYIRARASHSRFGSLIETAAESWQHLPPNSVWPLSRMQWNRRKTRRRRTKKRNGRPKRLAHISSLLTGLRATPGILVKVYVEVSAGVAFKRTNEIGWFMVSLQNFMACFT